VKPRSQAASGSPAPALPLDVEEGPPVSSSSRRALLALARAAVEAAVARGVPPPGPTIADGEFPEDLRRPFPAFVTLTEDGDLRGCMGRLDEEAPVWENVVAAAATAAVGDPRFEPVDVRELASIAFEISVLSAPVEISDPELFDPSRHGIIVERGPRRGLLLPQVAREHGWDRRETLEAACWKAGLAPDAWRDPDTRLSVFTATVFGEAEANAGDDAGPAEGGAGRLETSTGPPDPA
jgi:AmmeMemoRadiSam system protein A